MRGDVNVRALGTVLAGTLALRFASRLLERKRLDGQVVFITGGSRGLGLAIGIEAAKRGANVAICGRDAGALERAAQRLREYGTQVLALACDVRDRGEIESTILRAAASLGRIDILVNNAGTIAVGPLDAMTTQDYADALNTHFWAMYYAVECVRAIFERQGGGRIANVTSIGGKISVPHLLPYCVSKFAAVGYSQGLRAALAPKRIRVTTVVPGLMRTGSPRNGTFKAQHQKEYTWFALSDALPGSSIGAAHAARQIVDAVTRGDAEIVLSFPAQIAVFVHGVAPGVVSNIMTLATRLLPRHGGVDSLPMPGHRSETALTRSPLTTLSRKAERDYNQI